MNIFQMPGGAADAVGRQAHEEWRAAAARSGIDMTGFDPDSPFELRLTWALRVGLLIACVYSRYSSKLQHSTADQVRANVEYAATHGMYVPPELICVDEAVKGRKDERPGLTRLKAILAAKLGAVLLVFKASRLFRRAYHGYQLLQEEVVEEGLRAVSVSQGIDTNSKGWKAQIQMYGVMDDLQLDTIADFVREGHIGLFKKGQTIGAVPVGLKAVEVPDGRLTRRGLPRTKLAVDERVADLIRQHAQWLLDDVPVWEGVRRWRAAGGPADPRSTTGKMSAEAYVRIMTNSRLTGRLKYGGKKNSWSSKRDGMRQIPQPEESIIYVYFEELRILSDDVAARLQALFANRKTGPRKPRVQEPKALWDLVTEVFYCGACGHRLYQSGAFGNSMRCPELDCPVRVMVDRQIAVQAICASLVDLLSQDADLIRGVMAAAEHHDAEPDDYDRREEELKRRIRVCTNKIQDLTELAGTGSEEDRSETKAKVKAAMAERAALQLEFTRLTASRDTRPVVTTEAVRERLAEFGLVLEEAAAGKLTEEAVFRAATVFTSLVGGRVKVIADQRAGRKQCTVRGQFTPTLIDVVADDLGIRSRSTEPAQVIEVWLREPPRLDAIAPEVRRLYEEEGLGFRAIATQLQIGCGNIYMSYLRYYELAGLPVPPRRPRGRSKRP